MLRRGNPVIPQRETPGRATKDAGGFLCLILSVASTHPLVSIQQNRRFLQKPNSLSQKNLRPFFLFSAAIEVYNPKSGRIVKSNEANSARQGVIIKGSQQSQRIVTQPRSQK